MFTGQRLQCDGVGGGYGSDLLSHGQLLLDPQQLVFGRHQVLLQVLLGGGVDVERSLVVLLQGGHRALQAAQVLLPRRPLVVGGGRAGYHWLLLCSTQSRAPALVQPAGVLLRNATRWAGTIPRPTFPRRRKFHKRRRRKHVRKPREELFERQEMQN